MEMRRIPDERCISMGKLVMDQRGAGNDFLLRERWNGTPFTPCPRPYSDLERVPEKATWTTTRGPAMPESDSCLHGWNIDHD